MWRHRQREQFARAVDAHPEPGDEAFADELAVVALLREAAVTSGPDEAARARMRERVLGPATPPTKLDSRRPRSGARGRLAVALAAALCLVFSLAGMSLLLSRDALPGDALYGVKRTAESASLGLTFGEDSKGHKLLEFASARLTELETLADRYSGDGPLGGYLTALADFDTDAAAGARVLTAFGSTSDHRTLEDLRDWAGSQATRLTRLSPDLPQDAVTRSASSLDLLAHIAERATALQSRTTCATTTSGDTDDLGPLPAEDECNPLRPTTAPADTTATTAQPPSTSTQPPTNAPLTTTGDNPGTPAPTTTADAPTSRQPTTAPTTTPGGPVLPLPTLPLPSLPLPGLGG
ncbi:DUF5667 domain-containing protein [Saccharothrix xinjiangensis]|uniref:DUF5667 domain-containing protein n=1 Tax=Saccharothrix xinjiangensis TaxID=204798 RepID=A0ABV9Y5J1_9PSEU